jgi:hypothetical protein
MKKLLLIVVIAALPLMAMGQPTAPNLLWRQSITEPNWTTANGICATSDLGFAITGNYNIQDTVNSSVDIYLLKLDSLGDPEWGGPLGHRVCYETPWAIAEAADGGLVVAGLSSCDTAMTGDWGDLIIMKVNSHGDSLWTRQFNMGSDDMAYAIERTADGGFVVAGYVMQDGEPNPMHGLIMRLNSNGDSLWTAKPQLGIRTCFFGVEETPEGGFVAAGLTSTQAQPTDKILVVKLDSQGGLDWQRSYSDSTITNDIAVDNDGGLAITGWRNEMAYLLRLTEDGDSLWMKTYREDSLHFSQPWKVEPRADGGFVLGGMSVSIPVRLDSLHWDPNHPMYQRFELTGVNSAGDYQWRATADSGAIADGRGLCKSRDGGFAIAGSYCPTDTSLTSEVHVARFGWDGTPVSEKSARLPIIAALAQNYPNPFNPSTEIRFELAQDARVKLTVYDILGQWVATLKDAPLAKGQQMITFDGSVLPSGVYFYRLETAGFSQTRKMLLMK